MADAAQLARLSSQLGYPVSDSETRERLSQILSSPTHIVLVADNGLGLSGWVLAECRLSLETGPRVEIIGLVVDATTRRVGIGRTLVALIERWALERGYSILLVRSNVVRQESHRFYDQLGYERVKTQHSYKKVLNAA